MPSFFRRLLLFASPGLWADARSWSIGSVLVPILAVQFLLEGGLAIYRGLDLRKEGLAMAATYDAKFDPVIFEGGQIRVDGPRLPRWDEGDTTFLVDPEEKVPLELLKGRRSIVFHRTTIIDSGRPTPMAIADIAKVFGIGDLRVDSASLKRFFEDWTGRIVLAMFLLLTFFGVVGLAITAPLGALLASLVLEPLRGKEIGLTRPQCFLVALAALSVRPPLELVLHLLGTSVGFCFGLLVWPAVAAGLSVLALRNLPPVASPAQPPPAGS